MSDDFFGSAIAVHGTPMAPTGRAEPPRAPTGPNPGYGEVFAAARTLQRADNSDYQDRLDEKAYAPVVEAINAFRRERGERPSFNTPNLGISATRDHRGLTNAYGAANAASIDRESSIGEIWGEIARIRAVNPGFLRNLPATAADYWKQVIAGEQAERGAARETMGRATGYGRTITGFAGGVAESFRDPWNIYLLPIGGMGRSAATRILSEGIVNTGGELLSQPRVAENRAVLGEELTSGEAVENVAGAFVGGAAFQGVGEGIAAGFRRAFAGRMTPDETAAVHVIEREDDIDATSPFEPDAHGPAQHRLKLGDTMERMMSDAPPPVKQRKVSRGTSPRPRPTGTVLDAGIVGFFRTKGYSEAQARGIAAGVAAESRNSHAIVNPDSGAHGLGQWLGPRKKALIKLYGPNPTREQQLEFLHSELQGGDAGGKSVLAGADEAAVLDAYIRDFMRPAKGAETSGDLRRGLEALGRDPEEAIEGGAVERFGDAGDDIDTTRPAAMDAERVAAPEVEAPDFASPQLRRDLFDSDIEWQVATAIGEGADDLVEERFIRGGPIRYDAVDGREVVARFDRSGAVPFLEIRDAEGKVLSSPIMMESEARSFAANIRSTANASDIPDPRRVLPGLDEEVIAPPVGIGAIWDKAREAGNEPAPVYLLRSQGGAQPAGYPMGWAPDLHAAEALRNRAGEGNSEIVRLDPEADGRARVTPVSRETSRETVSSQLSAPLIARFSDPASAEIRAAADGLTHDVRAGIEAGTLDQTRRFDTGDGEADAAAILDALDGDDAAIAAVEACL